MEPINVAFSDQGRVSEAWGSISLSLHFTPGFNVGRLQRQHARLSVDIIYPKKGLINLFAIPHRAQFIALAGLSGTTLGEPHDMQKN